MKINKIGTAVRVEKDHTYGINDYDQHVFMVDEFEGTFMLTQGELYGELDSGLTPEQILLLSALSIDFTLTDDERNEKWGNQKDMDYTEAMEHLSKHTYSPSNAGLLDLTSSDLDGLAE